MCNIYSIISRLYDLIFIMKSIDIIIQPNNIYIYIYIYLQEIIEYMIYIYIYIYLHEIIEYMIYIYIYILFVFLNLQAYTLRQPIATIY